jgi:deoxyribose-phosphate aldolase
MIPAANINEIPSLYANFSINSSFETEINTIFQKSLGNFNEEQTLKLIFSLIDLTSLEGADTTTKINEICNKVLLLNQVAEIPNVAAICVYPTFAKLVSQKMSATNLNTACVAGAFPSGQSSLEVKLKEIEWAIQEGATEIDMVISRGKLIEGNYQEVFDEIVAIKKCCGKIHLKVIIESGELGSNKNIRIASDLAMYAGADFIKTSTGKISEGATYNSVYIMLNAINDFYNATQIKVGMKPAGGISDAATAVNYLKMVEQIVGKDWLNNHLFRFGASSLANNVLNDLSVRLKQPNLNNYFKK